MSVSSPCIQICHIDVEAGFCAGCARTIDEICRWVRMSDAEKREVLERINARLAVAGDVPPE